jgi:signal transduction histidine kinase/ligand-binding sensor domain-containing protein
VHRPDFKVRSLCRVLFALVVFWFLGSPIFAADYVFDTWDTENALPSSTVTSIAQTPDGYLWIGTYNGLARFDGVRFVTFDPVNKPELTHARVQGLYLDATGTLWINTFRGGLTSYRDGVFRNEWPDQSTFDLHTALVSSSSNEVVFVTQFGEVIRRAPFATNAAWNILLSPPGSLPIYQCTDGEGTLWFLKRDGNITRVLAGRFTDLPDNGGLKNRKIFTLVADEHGQVWAGAENKIARWDGKEFVDLTPPHEGANLEATLLFPTRDGALWVLDGDRFRKAKDRLWLAEADEWQGLLGWASGRAMGAHEDNDGGMWFNHYGNGLFHVTPNGHLQRLTQRDGLPGDRVGAWFQDSEGGVWVGVDHGGLARVRDRKFHVVGTAEGLPVRATMSICQSGDGTTWIGTGGGGLCGWAVGKVSHYAVGTSASANFVFSTFPRYGGGLWLSAAEGEELYEFNGERVQHSALEVHGVKSLLTASNGVVWAGTKSGVAWWSDKLPVTLLGTNDNIPLPSVRALALAPDGTVWAGADDGVLYRCSTNQLTAFRPGDALAEQPIYSLYVDHQGVVWAGTFRGGLLRFKDGKFARIAGKQGLSVDVICQILEDNQGRLWFGTHQGIYCVSRAALNACAEGRTNTVNYTTYGRHDGLPALECADGYQPACWRANDGKLWFTTVRGAVWLNPDELTTGSSPPPVVIEEFQVDGEPQKVTGGTIIIPPGHRQFEFRFTALSFDSGEKARFRYRLDNFDAGWVDADSRRPVQYGNLTPRDYRFRVIACNGDGVWNDIGATIKFEVQPFFYQTWWFKIMAATTVVGGISLGVRRAATRKYRRKLALLQQQHAIERDRTRIAKDIHDDIGAGLTQITLLTELAARDPAQTAPNLDRISESARRLTKAMDEIVWAVDPQHDTLNGLMDYISAFAEDFLRVAGIRCRMDLPMSLPSTRVDAELRYNLFLAVKEALNNVVKHSRATEVWLRLWIEPKQFTLIIEDNGQGLPLPGMTRDAPAAGGRIASGSGLSNLEKRMAANGGRCSFHSTPGQGTRVELTAVIETGASPVVAIGSDGGED